MNDFKKQYRPVAREIDWEGLVSLLIMKSDIEETCAFVHHDDYWALGSSEKRFHLFSVQALIVPAIDTSLQWAFFFVYLSPDSMEVWDEESNCLATESVDFSLSPSGIERDLHRAASVLVLSRIIPRAVRVSRKSIHLVRNDGSRKGPYTLRPVPGEVDPETLESLDRVQGVRKPLEIEPWLNGHEPAAYDPTAEDDPLEKLSTDFDFGFGG